MSTSWEYSRQIVFDDNGKRCPGALAFFFEAGTLTPLPVYQDAALSVAHTHPVEADASGRMPRVYLPTGTYRIRVTKAWTDPPNNTVPGVVLWDDDDVDGTPVQVVQGETVDETKIARTGDYRFSIDDAVQAGWVRANGRTIGSAVSGATERANSDTEDLFELVWNKFSDDICPVAGGRGSTAAADWAADKTIQLPDNRHRALFGLGGMGNTNIDAIDASLFAEGDGTSMGAYGGTDEVTLTTAEIPGHTHTGTTESDGTHHHELWSSDGFGERAFGMGEGSGVGGIGVQTNAGGGTPQYYEDVTPGGQQAVEDAGAHTHDFTSDSTGDGGAHNNMPPFALCTIYLKL